MKNIILLFLIAFSFSLSVNAQQLIVESFVEATDDLEARTEKGTRLDTNNHPCALVKVRLLIPGAKFGGSVVEASDHLINHYKVYMTDGAKFLTIDVPGYLPQKVMFSDYQVKSLQGTITYYLTLVTDGNPMREQYLEFHIEPSDAMVELEGEPLAVTNGIAAKRVPFGTYNYSISLDGYHTAEGRVSVYSRDSKTVKDVVLKPAHGWLDINGDASLSNSKVYIDGKLIGEGPVAHCKLSSGDHKVRVLHSDYKPFEQDVCIADSQTVQINVNLLANFADVLFSVADDAEIWVDGVCQGQGRWETRLSFGHYAIETRLPNRKTALTEVQISPDGPTSFTLDAPAFYYGGADISTSPLGAELFLDGESLGQSPQIISNIKSGNHQLSVSKPGYETQQVQIVVEADKTTEYNIVLKTGTKPSPARNEDKVKRNDQSKLAGVAPKPVISRNLPLVYADVNYTVGSVSGLGLDFGTYIGNFNVEASFIKGMGSSETVYWLDGTASPYGYVYSPTLIGLKAGYCIAPNEHFRLTPQLGLYAGLIGGSVEEKGKGKDPEIVSASVVPASVGVRLEYCITRNFGLVLSPELLFAVQQGETFEALSSVSDDVKGFGSGFNCGIGIFVNF